MWEGQDIAAPLQLKSTLLRQLVFSISNTVSAATVRRVGGAYGRRTTNPEMKGHQAGCICHVESFEWDHDPAGVDADDAEEHKNVRADAVAMTHNHSNCHEGEAPLARARSLSGHSCLLIGAAERCAIAPPWGFDVHGSSRLSRPTRDALVLVIRLPWPSSSCGRTASGAP